YPENRGKRGVQNLKFKCTACQDLPEIWHDVSAATTATGPSGRADANYVSTCKFCRTLHYTINVHTEMNKQNNSTQLIEPPDTRTASRLSRVAKVKYVHMAHQFLWRGGDGGGVRCLCMESLVRGSDAGLRSEVVGLPGADTVFPDLRFMVFSVNMSSKDVSLAGAKTSSDRMFLSFVSSSSRSFLSLASVSKQSLVRDIDGDVLLPPLPLLLIHKNPDTMLLTQTS
ncbi:unnamed protein product, partial [Timema podura]|nr:unnamed protein product [Timema podura]